MLPSNEPDVIRQHRSHRTHGSSLPVSLKAPVRMDLLTRAAARFSTLRPRPRSAAAHTLPPQKTTRQIHELARHDASSVTSDSPRQREQLQRLFSRSSNNHWTSRINSDTMSIELAPPTPWLAPRLKQLPWRRFCAHTRSRQAHHKYTSRRRAEPGCSEVESQCTMPDSPIVEV